MGESLSEGTVTKWLKKVGDRIRRDEPLFEISTDKVDTEVPAPTTGVLEQILVVEGQTVPVGTVVGQIGAAETKAEAPAVTSREARALSPDAPGVGPRGTGGEAPPHEPASPEPARGHFSSTHEPSTFRRREMGDRRAYVTPAVTTAARENEVPLEELSRIRGSGLGGRVTRRDVESYARERARTPEPAPPASLYKPSRDDTLLPMSNLRRKMADLALESHRVAPQATTFAECDLNRIVRHRDERQASFESAEGIPLTFLPFAADATIKALKEIPLLNASIVGEQIALKRHVHLGIAVALPEGIVTPVILHADEMNFVGLARSIHNLTERARAQRLELDEMEGATFTITNPGMFGGLTGTFLIPPPQVAILGLGAVSKKPTVIDDGIAIRPIMVLALSYDQRVIDPAAGFQFIERVRLNLEHFDLG